MFALPLVAVVVKLMRSGIGAPFVSHVTVNVQLSPSLNSRPVRTLVAVRFILPVAV